MLAAAEAAGRDRLADNHRRVLANLVKIILALETIESEEAAGDRSEQLRRVAQARHVATTPRPLRPCWSLISGREPVTFGAVARRAGISRSWLYRLDVDLIGHLGVDLDEEALELLGPVGLESKCPPDPLDGGLARAHLGGHRPRRPVGGVFGFSSKVLTVTASTWSSLIFLGAPGRGSSKSPARRCSTKQRRHLPTMASLTPSSEATSRLARPLAQLMTILALMASAWALFRRLARRSSTRRSSVLNTSSASGRPPYPMAASHRG